MVAYGLKVTEENLPPPERTETTKGNQGWEVETYDTTTTKALNA